MRFRSHNQWIPLSWVYVSHPQGLAQSDARTLTYVDTLRYINLGSSRFASSPSCFSKLEPSQVCATSLLWNKLYIRPTPLAMSAQPIDSVQEFREIVSHYTRASRFAPSNASCLIDHQIRSASPVIVFFHCVDWSRPCKQITPVFDECSSLPELQALRFYKVDCDHQPDISSYCHITNVCCTSHLYVSTELMFTDPGVFGLPKWYQATWGRWIAQVGAPGALWLWIKIPTQLT